MYIKRFRKANNISQKALAEFAGVTQSAVSQWESGLTNIPSPILQRLFANDKGWDTTALLESDAPTDNSNHGNVTTIGNISGTTNSPTTVNNGNAAELMKVIEELREQNKSQREQIRSLHEQNQSLTDIIKGLTSK